MNDAEGTTGSARGDGKRTGDEAETGAEAAGAAVTVPSAGEVVASAVRHAAMARVAVLGPHLIALVVKSASPVTVPPVAAADEQTVGERLRAGTPLTALADPQVGQDHLGPWGQRPGSVGDLLAARSTDGTRVIGELHRQCAIEAARLAPALADELVAREPDLAERLAAQHAAALVGPGEGRIRADAVLCAEVAALLVIELVDVVLDQLVDLPVSPTDPDHAA